MSYAGGASSAEASVACADPRRAHAINAIADGSAVADKHAALHALSVCAEAAAALPHERSSVPWSTSMLCEYSKSIINADAVPVVSLHFWCI